MHVGNVVASYTHVHALGLPQWAPGLVQAARAGVLNTNDFDAEEDSASHVEGVMEARGPVPAMSAQQVTRPATVGQGVVTNERG
jgi:hypothetical protein